MISLKLNKIDVIKKVRTDYLKLIAMLLMLVDHLGYVLNIIPFRAIGRLSFPIFCYLLVVGNQRTSNIKKYFIRLLIFAFISQIPYMFLFETSRSNIFMTLVLGLFIININFKSYKLTLVTQVATIFLFGVASMNSPFDYGVYGLLLILIFHLFYDKKINFVMFNLVTLSYSLIFGMYIQLFSILVLPLIYSFRALEDKYKLSLRLNKYLFYSFYPVHLLILLWLKIIIK